jgi:MFS family permease
MSSVSTWFYHHRALSFGVMASGSSLGGVIFPIMVQQLIPKVGFGWSMRITAFLILAMLAFANVTVKSRLTPNPSPLNPMEFVRPLQEWPFFLTTIGALLFAFGMFLPINYVIVHGIHLGMSVRLSGYLIPILNAARYAQPHPTLLFPFTRWDVAGR